MEGVLGEDRRKSLRVLNWAIRLTQTIRSQPRGSCLASSPLLGTNGRLARWGNSRPPISPPRARPVIQGAVENGCALAFSAGALVNFPAPVGTITLCSQLSGHSSRLQHGSGAGEPRIRAGALPFVGLRSLAVATRLAAGIR
jgi:hypothetical protein